MRAVFALCALVLLVVAFAWLAPASLVDERVASASGGRVRLADAAGTVWHGAGVLTDAQGRWRIPLAWRVDALPLARGALSLTLVPAAGDDPQGALVADSDTLRITGLRVAIPAAALETLWPRPPVPRLDGVLSLDAPAFTTDGRKADGAFDLRWSRASVSFAGLRASLGTVEARAQPAQDALLIALSNQGGDVTLRGNATLRNDSVAVDATLTPLPTLAPAVAAGLRALGPADPDGTVHLAWQKRR